jgi:DNA damage-binding protein 1
MLYGTVAGAIGVVASLDANTFAVLKRIETALANTVRGVGGLEYARWRRVRLPAKEIEPYAFVDGDLLQVFADLQPAKQTAVATASELTVPQIAAMLEQLSRATCQ